ncbi:hypothetical protein [Thermoflexus hugenholtzii]
MTEGRILRFSWLLFPLVLVMALGSCAKGEGALTVVPSPTPETLTIEVNGEKIVLRPGVNILPEHYALAMDPEFRARSRWILVEGMWQPIAEGISIPIDICEAYPDHPDCRGLHAPTPPHHLMNRFVDPLGRFVFFYPTGWYTMTVTPDPSDGVQVMNAPSLQESTRWISLHVFQNPHRASLSVWLAEQGPGWPGSVTEQKDEVINGVPVLIQRLENNNPDMGGPYVYTLLWYLHEDWVLRWTAWPGEQDEVVELLRQIVYTFRWHSR